MAYTMDTKLGELLSDPRAMEMMDKYAPGVAGNPIINFVKGASLRTLVSLPQAVQMGFSQERVQSLLDEINDAP